ncbi:three-Cys-motif partner protein TcmP [Mesorhizobium australicum]|uniref:three-Cys-motif partner protein TcmP n=1 Tax=Mesorhizobium australicum TaxID=536018 RepID=UPI00333C3353
MTEDHHFFGGDHTEIKLDILQKYLKTYTAALKQKFRGKLWYIDAFAGTGSRTIKTDAAPADLFREAEPERIETRRGSAKIALDIKPEFDRLIFMDARSKHCDALRTLAAAHPDRDITVAEGDANKLIQEKIKWDGWKATRAVLFLDPYGTEVEWATLQAIAATKAIDVWYLFSLAGLYRNAARDISAVDPSKRRTLTRLLGTDEWEAEIYSTVKRPDDLLGALDLPEVRQRHSDVAGLESYVQRRLRTIFPAVLPPFGLPLPTEKGPQRFSLFFAVSNDSPAAINLASRFGGHILRAPITASRHKSDR